MSARSSKCSASDAFGGSAALSRAVSPRSSVSPATPAMICRVRLAICLPTYNERENLEAVVRALGAVFAEHALDGSVLVVDDGSPDGTGGLADELARELPWVGVL